MISNNLSYHARQACPNPGWHEQNAVCSDPLLVEEAYPAYGLGDLSLAAQSPAKGKGTVIPGLRVDRLVRPRNQPPAIGAFEGMDY